MDIEEQLANLSKDELDRLVDNIQRITLFLGKTELQKALARKIAKFEKSLERVEKWMQQPSSVRKSIRGQDSDGEENDKWPSLSKLFGD
jgi:hypothetical protein